MLQRSRLRVSDTVFSPEGERRLMGVLLCTSSLVVVVVSDSSLLLFPPARCIWPSSTESGTKGHEEGEGEEL